jgi:DNA-directed RNA polymerase specialized sigma24 family protein
VLRYLIQMNTREVAEILRVSEGTVKNSLAKARAALAAKLQVQTMEVPIDADDR